MKYLANTTAVVAGGTGSVGEGIVRTLLSEGARVIVPWRSEEKKNVLYRSIADEDRDRLVFRQVALDDESSVVSFRDWLEETEPRLDLAVACLGGWYYGYSLHNMPYADWQRIIKNHLETHFLFGRSIVSLMHKRHHGTYVMINGGASKLVAPESGVVSIVAAAQKMMAKVFAEEAHGTEVRVYSVVAFNPVKTRDRGVDAVEEWLSADDLGRYVAHVYRRQVPNPDAIVHTIHSRKDLQ